MADEQEKFGLDILQGSEEPEVVDALKDLVMLSGVLKDLAAERFWGDPQAVFDTLRAFELIRRSTFYEEDAVQGEEELAYRFQRIHGRRAGIEIPRLVRLGQRYNWVSDSRQPPLKFTNTGKRMINQIFRIANDSLFYHRQSPSLREIYQAERDLQLAKAYEDIGIGRQDTVASVLHNLENAVNDLRYQREKYVQDRKALEKYSTVLALVEMLEKELAGRLNNPEMIVDRKLERQHQRATIVFYRVIQELSALLGENAVTAQLQVGRRILRIDRDKFLQYLVDVYGGQTKGLVLKPLQILQYMEEGVYDEESIGGESDLGLWMPFHLPFFVHDSDIEKGREQLNHWIEKWEPPEEDIEQIGTIVYEEARQVTATELAEIIGYTTSISAELATDTRLLVEYIKNHPGASVAEIINNLGTTWGEVVRQLFALGFLITEGEVRTFVHKASDEKEKILNYLYPVNYPEEGVRYIKGTNKLGAHLEKGAGNRNESGNTRPT